MSRLPADPRQLPIARRPAVALAAAVAAAVTVAAGIGFMHRTPACAEEAPAAPEVREPALRGLDPVELCGGREVEGRPEHVRQRGEYSYRFATGENARRFDADPAAFSVRFGGACMRMGPLAGRGSPDRWTVHEGRIYLFASEACRATFLKEPARFIDADDPPATGTPADAARGAELLELAVRAAGGREALAKTRNIRISMSTVRAGDAKSPATRTDLVFVFPSTYRVGQSGEGWSFAWMLAGDTGRLPAESEAPVEDDVRRHMSREMYRRPPALLAAWLRGEAKAFALTPEKRGDAVFERVSVSAGGATSVLVLDAAGSVVEARFRHRAGDGIRDVVRQFSDFRPAGKLVLPFATTVLVDGRPSADTTSITGIEVDAENALPQQTPAAGEPGK